MSTKMLGIVALLVAIGAVAFFMYRRTNADAARRATDDARNAAAARSAAAAQAAANATKGGGLLDTATKWALGHTDDLKTVGMQIGSFFGGDNLTAG